MKIVTISREFGSGGREVGKRLADELGFRYYDREIIEKIAEKSRLDEGYVEAVLEGHMAFTFPVTFGRTFLYTDILQQNMTDLLVAEHKCMKEIAEQGDDFVIVGRSADEILRDYKPFNIFVYAEMDSKVRRCRERAPKDENLTDKELVKKIKQVDSNRARQRKLISGSEWGKKETYHLCLNTTDTEIKDIVPPLAEFIRRRFK